MRRRADEEWFADRDPAADVAADGRARLDLEGRLEAEGERRFLFAPVCLGCGIALFFGLGHDPSPVAVGLGGLLAGLSAWRLRPGSVSRHVACAVLLVLLGMMAAIARTASVDAPVVAESTRARLVEGRVERIERDPSAGDRVTIRVSRIEDLAPENTPRRVTVRSRLREARYEVGAAMGVRAVLLPPPDAARPGGFDYARQAFFAGIGATGYAVSRPQAIDGPPPGLMAAWSAGVERLRDRIGARIRAAMRPVPGAVATALVTGQRSHIPEATEEALRAAGLAHILAISGLHMMLAVGAIFATIRYGAALVPQVALTRPVKKWAAALALLGGTAYLVISGGSVATQRAYVMAAVLLLAVLADRPAITMRNVALAALVILVLRPEAVVTAGFQMSFAATIALVAAYEQLRARRRRRPVRPGRRGGALAAIATYAGGLTLTSFVAGAATAPYAAYHFHRVATYGLAGNLLAMPLFGFLVMPAGLIAMILMPFGLEYPFLVAMGWGIEAIVAVAGTVAALDGAVRPVRAFPPLALFAMTIGALWLGLWRTGWRSLGFAGIAAGVVLSVLASGPDLHLSGSGRTALLRDGDALTLVGRRGSDYEREHWLAAWGRSEDTELARAPCDDVACFHAGGPLSLSLVGEPAAFADDCGLADLVVATPAPPVWCGDAGLVVTRADLARSGAIAGTVETGQGGGAVLRLATSSGATGARPWNWRWRAHGPPDIPERHAIALPKGRPEVPAPRGDP